MTRNLRNPRHQAVVNMVGHALTLGTKVDAWRGLSTVLQVRLSPFERGSLAAAALDASEDEEVFKVVETVLPTRLAGVPMTPWLDIAGDARWWADCASLRERRAYLAASFTRLPASEQVAFLDEARRAAA